MARKVKWARVSQIDRRCKVGTPTWYARHPAKVRRLSAWRRVHMVAPHTEIRTQARLRKRIPSSALHTREMISLIRMWHG